MHNQALLKIFIKIYTYLQNKLARFLNQAVNLRGFTIFNIDISKYQGY